MPFSLKADACCRSVRLDPLSLVAAILPGSLSGSFGTFDGIALLTCKASKQTQDVTRSRHPSAAHES